MVAFLTYNIFYVALCLTCISPVTISGAKGIHIRILHILHLYIENSPSVLSAISNAGANDSVSKFLSNGTCR